MSSMQEHSTWVEVNLGAIKNHVRYFRQHSGVQVMAIVKANAYGHGAAAVAQAALEAGAAWCGVARVEEALELRAAGIHAPLFILGYTPPARYEEMILQNVSMAVWDVRQIDSLAAAATRLNRRANLHLKVDTGMSRLGVSPHEALPLLQEIKNRPALRLEGLFTHFACADEADPAPTDAQEAALHCLLADVKTAGIQIPFVHAANSAVSLTRPGLHLHGIRTGIAMYGLHPSTDCRLPPQFKPALTWKAVLSQVKVLPPGRGVSYGHEYVTTRQERIGTVPVGYADGFRRIAGNEVLVGGRKVPVIGRVTMDQIMVQLDSVPEAQAGAEVVLLGCQGKERIFAEDIAARWQTINYEVTSGIARRVPRIYLG